MWNGKCPSAPFCFLRKKKKKVRLINGFSEPSFVFQPLKKKYKKKTKSCFGFVWFLYCKFKFFCPLVNLFNSDSPLLRGWRKKITAIFFLKESFSCWWQPCSKWRVVTYTIFKVKYPSSHTHTQTKQLWCKNILLIAKK